MRRLLILVLLAACGDDDDVAIDGGTIDAAPIDAGAVDAGPDAGAAQRGFVRISESSYVEHTFSLIEARFAARLPSFHRVAASEGACELLVWDNPFCDPACTSGFCVEGNRCEPHAPPGVDVGEVTVTGLATEVAMSPGVDGWYAHGGTLPSDMFADDAVVTLAAAGDDWPAFTIVGGGVPRIDPEGLAGDRLAFVRGEDRVIRWTASGVAGARVRLALNATNIGHGFPLAKILRCEVDDAAGELVVPKALLAQFPELYHEGTCVHIDCPPSLLSRIREDRADVQGGWVSLEVVAERNFYMAYPR